MMFLFRHPTIILNCYTANASAFEYAKPQQAIKFIPEWWLKIPKTNHEDFNPDPTMKRCAGFIDYFKTGFVLPLWSDLDVKVGPKGTEEYKWQFADRRSEINPHYFSQMNNYLNIKEHVHLKLINPWVFSCNEDIKWLWTSFAWYDLKNPNINILSGVISFKHQSGAHINMFLTRALQEQIFHFRLGTPLVHVVPLTEQKVVIKHHLVSYEEYSRIKDKSTPLTFFNTYSQMKKQSKKNNK